MEVLQLRNHIPIGSPARREPVDGTERPLRVSLGFEPQWFHLRCGVDFGERWHTDPWYRCESRRRMKAELQRSFPRTDYWDSCDDPEFASLSGCYGIHVIPLAFGGKVTYHQDRWPTLDCPVLVDSLAAPAARTILESPFAAALFRQMDEIEAGWGAIRGYLNWQGVLNNAFHLRGQQLFMDVADCPEGAAELFAAIRDAIVQFANAVQQRQRDSGFDIDEMSVSNCTVSMISPRMYRRMVQPHDAAIADSFARFGVHTCNWNVTPYVAALSELPKVGYLDMGLSSDFAAARASFPSARLAAIYTPSRLLEGNAELYRSDLDRIRGELAPCDVVLADLPVNTPDERVNEFLSIAATLE